MKIQPAADDLFEYLLDRISGANFETFAKRIFADQFSESFVPLGGFHDGGADGLISSFIQEVEEKANTFAQFSATAEDNAKTKILETITALRKTGRDVKQLIYATSRKLPKSDTIVTDVYEKEVVLVSIRDHERLKSYVNSNLSANSTFYDFFNGEITALTRAASIALPSVSSFAKDPTVYVFLNHELRDRFTNDKLNIKVLDALIYWALRDTDPDKSIVLHRSEIAAAIQQAFPAAKNVLLANFNQQLEILSKKDAGVERLRHYKAKDSFCLPYEMRKQLAVDASAALLEQERFRSSIRERLIDESASSNPGKAQLETGARLVFSTVHRYFIDQGLLLAAFLERKLDTVQVADQIVEDIMVEVLAGLEHRSSLSPQMFGYCLATLRGIFYHSTQDERAYLHYLSRTSCLLVTLHSAPSLLEYLNQMAGNFRLIVGTDILIKAISERYLEEPFRQVTNLLLAAKKMGSHLVLAEPVLTEIYTHLHAVDLEFRNHYAQREPYLKDDDVASCDRILIRSYLYASRDTRGPNSWGAYMNQLTDTNALRAKSEAGKQALQGWLTLKFGMSVLSADEMEKSVSVPDVEALAARLNAVRERPHADLAYNDALLAYAVYSLRRQYNETAIYDGFGYRTWWLTKETKVLGLTGALVAAKGGVPYIMRPEFLLNFVTLAPKAGEVRKALAGLLPTTAGLQLGNHLSEDVVNRLLDDAAQWSELDPERVSVLISERVNLLTHTRFKQYIENV